MNNDEPSERRLHGTVPEGHSNSSEDGDVVRQDRTEPS